MKRSFSCFLLLTFIFLMPLNSLAYTGVPSWAEEEFLQADQHQIIPEILTDVDMSGNVTRLEFCHIALNIYELMLGMDSTGTYVTPFSDVNDRAVSISHSLGIVDGYPDGTFMPDNMISRQELFKMLGNLMDALGINIELDTVIYENIRNSFPDAYTIQSWAEDATYSLLAMGVISGTDIGGISYLDPTGTASRTQAILLSHRFFNVFFSDDSSSEPEQPEEVSPGVLSPGTSLTTWGMNANTSTKLLYVFGTDTDWQYQSNEEALQHMVWVTIPTWTLLNDGTKAPSQQRLQVHEAIADTVVQIFTEIFEGNEQFPIKDVGCYSWRGDGTSEHNWGLAIDINWNENYYINLNSGAQTGELWAPGENPYSIPADGDVVNTFHKYGFGWGGDGWWSSVRDYMHFSFLST